MACETIARRFKRRFSEKIQNNTGGFMTEPIQKQFLPRCTPEEQGVSSQSILTFLDSLEAGGYNIHSLMLLRHGNVIAEGWRAPYDPTCRRYVYSLSKSFTSTAIGFAVQAGLLTVEDKVISFFPDDLPESVGENMAAMRVKDLLTMTSGHGIDTLMMVLPRGLVNWAQSILTVSVDYPPGSHFLYNTGASYLLSCIVSNLTGQSVLDYLTRRFFEPLGITGATWDVCPRGISTGGWGLSVNTEDLAKFGQFYLQKGCWNGKQLLSAAWVEEATRAQVRNDLGEREKEPVDWRQGYGYQFWRCQHGAYRADGAAGQYCVVMPEQDAVLVITSEIILMQGILDRVWEHLLPGMQNRLASSTHHAQDELDHRLVSLQIVPAPATALPEKMKAISNKCYQIEENTLGVQRLSFSFEPDSCWFRLRDEAGEYEIACGNGSWQLSETRMPLMQPSTMKLILGWKIDSPEKVAAYGQWTDPSTYKMTWQYLETPHSSKLTCLFKGSEIQVDVSTSIMDLDSHNPFLLGKDIHLKGKLSSEIG
jgi:CubicO group peptidase (beta-lactamase class C family)